MRKIKSEETMAKKQNKNENKKRYKNANRFPMTVPIQTKITTMKRSKKK